MFWRTSDDKDSTYYRSKKLHIEEVEELVGTRVQDMTMEETTPENHEDHDMEEPREPIESLYERNSHNIKLAWAWELLQDAKKYGAPYGMHRERKRNKLCTNYVDVLCDIIDKEPSNYEEAAEKKEWKDAISRITSRLWRMMSRR